MLVGMLRNLPHCCWRRLTAGGEAYNWRVEGYFVNKLCSDSKISSSLDNYCIRKRRKWPVKPYKTLWLQNFAFQLAKRLFNQKIKKSNLNLVSDLRSSFAAYEISPTSQSYNMLVKVLIRKRPVNWNDQLSEILDHFEKGEFKDLPEPMFIDLIKFYGENGMYDDAFKLFLEMAKYKCDPSMEILKALLLILCSSDRSVKIVPLVLMKSMGMMNIRIDGSIFEILIRALCKKGNANGSIELLKHMAEEGFEVDQNVCSLILSTMCRKIYTDDACDIIGFFEDLKRLGFEPRIIDYRNMIRFLSKWGNGIDSLKLLRQMKLERFIPDITSYNYVLHALIFNTEFSKADKLFDELLVVGCIPDINTYTVYINGLCMQNRIVDGIQMISSMKYIGCDPNFRIYNSILRTLFESGNLESVEDLVSEILEKFMHLNSNSCGVTGLLGILVKRGAYDLYSDIDQLSF